MKRILIAFDGSEHALKACKLVQELSKMSDLIEIEILSVITPEEAKDSGMNITDSLAVKDLQRQKAIHEKIANYLTEPMSFSVKILHGKPALAILDYEKENTADILAIGSRGLNSLQEFVMGSVSHKVVKHAKSPVLVVK